MSAVELLRPVRAVDHDRSTRPPDPVLDSTLEPGCLPAGPIVRRRLIDAITRGVERRPLTLLSAPAGSGKTVLAASWAAANAARWPLAWLTVDDACNQTGPFWRCLVAALGRAGAGLDDVEVPAIGDAVPRSLLMRLSAELLGRDRPVVVVLDGADRSLTPETLTALDFLIRHAHPRFRLVMCGRADPQLPLHRYRLADTMTELRYDDLAFTVAETRELFASFDAPVSAAVAEALTGLTEGWAAGLRLAAASLQQGADPDTLVDSLLRDDGSIAEYLFAEVLDAQPADVRRLLLRTSVCEQLWPDLVDVLTDRRDARRTLAELVTANAFVQRAVSPPGTYRVHALFRELLRAQLNYESAADVPALHRQCADWFAAAGQSVVAAGHAIAGADAPHAATILVESGAVAGLLAQENSPYPAIVESLPVGLAGDDAALLRAARAVRAGGTPDDADGACLSGMVAADSAASAVTRTVATVVQAAAATATAGTAAQGAHAVGLADDARRRLADLPEAAAGEQRAQLAAIAQLAAAVGALTSAGPVASREAWILALEAADTAGASRLRRSCLAGLALAEALAGRLGRAIELGEAAEQLADELSVARSARPAAAALAIAWAKCEQLQLAEARHWSTLAQRSAADQLGGLCESVGVLLRARLLHSRHETDAAVALLEPAAAAVDLPCWLREFQLAELAAAYLAQARPDQATAIADAAPDPRSVRVEIVRARAATLGARSQFAPGSLRVEVTQPLDVRVDASLQLASAALGQGGLAATSSAVEQAWQLARDDGMRRPFLESGPELRRHIRTDPALAQVAAWLRPSAPVGQATRPRRAAEQRAAGRRASATAPELVDAGALTDREIEVLRLLSDLLSTEEIGAAMFVSINTVRTHIRSILRKLAVSRRNEAVRRARELDLV